MPLKSLLPNPYCTACLSMQGPRCALQTRILFHCAHQMGDEAKLMQHHQQLSESTEDQLSLASIHYLRGHYQVGSPCLNMRVMLCLLAACSSHRTAGIGSQAPQQVGPPCFREWLTLCLLTAQTCHGVAGISGHALSAVALWGTR